MYILFAALSDLAQLMTIVSLITPETAFFLKEKTRKKAFFSWLGIAIVAFALFSALHPAAR